MSRISGSNEAHPSTVRGEASRPDANKADAKPSREAQEAFRAMLHARATGGEAGAKEPQVQEEAERPLPGDTSRNQAGDLPATGHAAADNATAPGGLHSAAASDPGRAVPTNPAVVELIEKHVRQLLASEGASRGEAGSFVMLKLDQDVLPDTHLRLEKTTNGWRIEADTTDHSAMAVINEHTGMLQDRFRQAGLGDLEVAFADGPRDSGENPS